MDLFFFFPFLKSLLSFVKGLILFHVLVFWLAGMWDLSPWPGTEPMAPAREGEVLSSGPPGKSFQSPAGCPCVPLATVHAVPEARWLLLHHCGGISQLQPTPPYSGDPTEVKVLISPHWSFRCEEIGWRKCGLCTLYLLHPGQEVLWAFEFPGITCHVLPRDCLDQVNSNTMVIQVSVVSVNSNRLSDTCAFIL